MDQKDCVNVMLEEIEQSGAQSLRSKLPNHFKGLTLEESVIFRWQYPKQSGGFGGFFTALMDAIKQADEGNLLRLSMGFKEMVTGLIKYRHLSGWSEELKTKLKDLDYI